MSSQIVFLGSWNSDWKKIGAEIHEKPISLNSGSAKTTPDLLILNLSSWLAFESMINALHSRNRFLKIILIADQPTWKKTALQAFTQGLIVECLSPAEAPKLESHIFKTIEDIQNAKQTHQYSELVKENNESLIQAKKQLEKAVEDKTRTLIESRAKLVQTNLRIESFRRSLIATYKASSMKELEQQLNLSLAETVHTNWVKIVFSPDDTVFEEEISNKLDFTYLRLPFYQGEKIIGSIFFMRPPKFKFTREEKDLLEKVSEAASLSYLRIQKLLDSEQFKLQWETTFNSVTEPVLIINANYEVLQSNLKEKPPFLNKCYEVLFNRTSACENCKFGETFSMKNQKNQIFEVRSQRIPFEGLKQQIYANIYTDVTDKLLLEAQLINTVRQADLGIVSSSIAHELNNPLAGMMTFTQLLKMDLNKTHPLFNDIELIETHLKRCRDIIQNLLSFVRQPDENKMTSIQFLDIFEASLHLVELQARYYGIKFHIQKESLAQIVLIGNPYHLTQALTAILQKSIRSILEKKQNFPQHKGHIEVEVVKNDDAISVNFFDNGLADEPNEIQLNSDLVTEKLFADYKIGLSFNIKHPAKYPQIFRAKLSIPYTLLKSGNTH